MLSPTKDHSPIAGLLTPKGGPQLCGSCTKAVRTVGVILLFLILGVIFIVLSFFRGMGDLATVGVTALLTLGCAGVLTAIIACTLGLSFSRRREAESSEVIASRTGKKSVNQIVCDGCSSTFQNPKG